MPLDKFNIEIKIAVSPAVKKYIAHKHDINPFVVSRTNLFGIFLHNCLAKLYAKVEVDQEDHPFVNLREKESKQLNLKVYSEWLTLSLTEDLYQRKGWYIHPQKQYDFNRLVEMMIEQELYFWVDTWTQVSNVSMDWAFYEFRDLLHLGEDDLTLKSMQKKYERYRMRVNA